jgi:hypothetical protein
MALIELSEDIGFIAAGDESIFFTLLTFPKKHILQ